MFRIRTFVTLLGSCLVLAVVSRSLLTAVHNRLGKPGGGAIPADFHLETMEKDAQAGQPANSGYGKLPLYFEPNLGQTDSQVKFIARGGGATTFLTATQAVFSLPIADWRLPTEDTDKERPNEVNFGLQVLDPGRLTRRSAIRNPKSEIANRQSAITMRLVGANPNAQIEGLDRLPGISNYFIGNDPKKWQTNIPQFAKVRYRDVYPDIDLLYYSNGRSLEYDFEVKPGAKPEQIKLTFQGADDIRLNEQGDLIVEAAGATLLQQKPRVHQNHNIATTVPADFVLTDDQTVQIALGPYDTGSTLTIDPEFDFRWVFLAPGQDISLSLPSRMAVDSSGNTYVVMQTSSGDLPVTPGAFQSLPASMFALKLSPTGTVLYSTYLGGNGGDTPSALVIDSIGNAYVAGSTASTNFPTTPGSFRRSGSGNISAFSQDGFVTKISATGAALVYSTYLGGGSDDRLGSIVIDGSGSAVVAGATNSEDFPVVAGAYQPVKRGTLGDVFVQPDGFVSKLTPTGSALIFSTYFGGSGADGGAARLDPTGDIVLLGGTNSSDLPITADAAHATYSGLGAGFIARFNATASQLLYSTYLESGFRIIDLSTNGDLYVTGNGLLQKISIDAKRILFSRKSPMPATGDFVLDPNSNLYFLEQYRLTVWDSNADQVLSTHLFGGYDPQTRIMAMAANAAGDVYVAGYSGSGVQVSCTGISGTSIYHQKYERFVARLSRRTEATLFVPVIVATQGLSGSYFSSELSLTNKGTNPAQLHFTYTPAFGGGTGTATDFLAAGQQKIVPDAMAYLRSLGVPIPGSGNLGGTLRVRFSGLSSSADAAVTARTTTPSARGQAGLAYAGIRTSEALTGPAYLCGLRQTAEDRSNVAIQNAGTSAEGDVVVRVTVFSGETANPKAVALPEERLAPGEFKQFNSILTFPEVNLSNAYALVERIIGNAPYYAYAVINDQTTSDGSFVPPVPALAFEGYPSPAIPVVVESEEFSSEVILTNWLPTTRTVRLVFGSSDFYSGPVVELKPGEQLVIPNIFDFLRDRGVSLPPVSSPQAGTLFVYKGPDPVNPIKCSDTRAFFAGARTRTRTSNGRYGVFYPAVLFGRDSVAAASVWLYGLKQDAAHRANLAFASTGFSSNPADSSITLRLEIFDGDTGQKVNTVEGLVVNEWKQLDSVLASYAPGTKQGYVRVTRVSGEFDFLTYAVVNDGATPGERTGDGAFIASSP